MSNCLEMLPFLQANMSQFIKDPLELAVRGDDVLVNADEELLMFLEEVVIYTFQQTVYHLTKVKVHASKVTLYCNRPFPSSTKSLFQSESKCEIFVIVISSHFNMNGN